MKGEFGESAITARFTGSDRYDTAARIAEGLYVGPDGRLTGYGAGLVTGRNFPDALSGMMALAHRNQPLLLTDPAELSRPTRDFLRGHAGEGERLDVFGGTTAVSDRVFSAAMTAFAG